MTEVKAYDTVEDSLLKFAVILAKCGEQYVLCKHRDRDTWNFLGVIENKGKASWMLQNGNCRRKQARWSIPLRPCACIR